MKKIIQLVVFCVCFLPVLSQAETLRCATTTSTENSGLLDYLAPMIAEDTGLTMQFVAVGTGAALRLGKQGDVDVVFVHAKGVELAMVEDGFFVDRHDVMFNDFVLIGPANDPAGVKGSTSIEEAFTRVAKAGALFVSRGDDSGTHKKERGLWQETAFLPTPATAEWYLEVGQGMAKSIRVADQKQAYILTDRGTLLAMQDSANVSIGIVFEGDVKLKNQYGVMAVNPKRHKLVNPAGGMTFINWLTSAVGQQAIDAFRNSKGDKLFTANAKEGSKR